MKTVVLIIIMCMMCGGMSADPGYELLTFDRDTAQPVFFNKFYFVHYLYHDFLDPFHVTERLDLASKKDIVKTIYYHLQRNYQQQLTITTTHPHQFVLRFRPMHTQDQQSLVIFTNYDVALQRIVPMEADPGNFYAQQYVIVEDKLIPRTIFDDRDTDENTLRSLQHTKNYARLAVFLLYDAVSTNDASIPKHIATGLHQNISHEEKARLQLTLFEYYLMRHRYAECEKIAQDVEKNLNKITQEQDRRYVHQELDRLREIQVIMQSPFIEPFRGKE